MFGFVYALVSGIGKIFSDTRMELDNDYLKSLGEDNLKNGKNPTQTYSDKHGKRYDIETGKQVATYRDQTGDLLVKEVGGDILRNVSEEEKLKKAAKLAAEAPEGTKAVQYDTWDKVKYKTEQWGTRNDPVEGRVFKDIETGELYVSRRFTWNDFIMSSNLLDPCSKHGTYINLWDTPEHKEIMRRISETDAKEDPIRWRKYNNERIRFELDDRTTPHRAVFYMDQKGYLVAVADDHEFKTGEMYQANEEQCVAFMQYFNEQQKRGGWQQTDKNYPQGCYFCNKWR